MLSVCMTTYNGRPFVSAQIESILNQIGEDDELLIGDDGSSDGTIEVIEAINDKRIHLFRNDFHNHILNFEDCLKKAKGDVIFMSDQDDVWLPGKVETMLKALENADLVCSNSYITDGELKHSGQLFFNDDAEKKSGFFRNLKRNQFVGCCIAFKRPLLNYALPFPKGLITHDMWLGLVAESVGKTRFIADPLILFRRHGHNVSSTGEKSRLSLPQQISYRITILGGLIRNCFLRRRK